MKTLIIGLSLAAVCAVPALAQRGGGRGGGGAGGGEHGGGFIPSHGPAPMRGEAPRAAEGRDSRSGADHRDEPRVQRDGRWTGHESGRNDPHYHLDHPWAHGRFPRDIGPHHVFQLEGGDRGRFFFGGFAFSVADWDYPFCYGWQWDTDSIVMYDDPDHDGWYLAYNTRLGTYLHVQYEGAF